MYSRRTAAARANANFTDQLLSSPKQSTEASDGGSPFREPTRTKPVVKKRYGDGRVKLGSRLPPRLVKNTQKFQLRRSLSVPESSATRVEPKKRSFPKTDFDSLTPLSSPALTPSSSPPPQKKKLTIKEKVIPFPFPVGNVADTKRHDWDLYGLGPFVWVLVDQDGNVHDPKKKFKVSKSTLWWPCKVEKAASPTEQRVRVQFFGRMTSKKGSAQDVINPCEKNICSFRDPEGRVRVTSFCLISAQRPDGIHASPRKRQRHDSSSLEDRWNEATELLKLAERDVEEDDLPDLAAAYSSYPRPTFRQEEDSVLPVAKPKKRRKKTENETSSDSDRSISVVPWTPPPKDETLTIPGELVLARESVASKNYWPAKILSYVPPMNRKQQAKYRVVFLDDEYRNVPRDWFFLSTESGFASCKLGEYQSAHTDQENADSDEDTTCDNRILRSHLSPSPEPPLPPPCSEGFLKLPVRTQFAYVKPVLLAVLDGSYEPTRNRRDAFFKGGSSRASTSTSAGSRGQMSVKDATEIENLVRDWVLSDERLAKFVPDEEEYPELGRASDVLSNSEPKAIDGSGRFSSLSPTEVSSSPAEPPPSSFKSGTHDKSLLSPNPSLSDADLAFELLSKTMQEHIEITKDDIPLVQNENHTRSRLKGCNAYEALSATDKILFCTNIMQPEAVLQVLLWRNGERTSMDVLDSDEEKRLHERGEALAAETDWVFDIVRLRRMAENVLARSKPKGTNVTNGRPRRGMTLM